MIEQEDTKALVPTAEESVDFYGDELVAVQAEGEVYVPIGVICEYMGLSWPGQRQRIGRDPVLSEALVSICVTHGESLRGPREMLCLPLKYLNGWLFGVNANRVKPELRERVIQYQRECYDILAQAFAARADERRGGSSLAGIREMALAIAAMAEQQMVLEGRVASTEEVARSASERLDRAALVVGEIGRRLKSVEGRIRPDAYITDEQAAEISLRVKALAGLMGGESAHYQSVFAELYRRFGVASYKLIRRAQYEEVLGFLEGWREEVAG
jgi:hypothetical protein